MKFNITILGVGSAVPTLRRNPSAQLVQINEEYLLIDCGEGTQVQLLKQKINFNQIKYILISHLHGDHILGLFGLLSSWNLHGRTHEVFLYAPMGLDEILVTYFRYSFTTINYPIHYIKIETDQSYILLETEAFFIKTFPLVHRIPCAGFYFSQNLPNRNLVKSKISKITDISILQKLKKGENVQTSEELYLASDFTETQPLLSYAYCSDTCYHEPIIEAIFGVKFIYHEATFGESEKALAQKTFHSTARQAATIAAKAQAQYLFLGHFSSRIINTSSLEQEAKEVFQNSIIAEEGKIYDLKQMVCE